MSPNSSSTDATRAAMREALNDHTRRAERLQLVAQWATKLFPGSSNVRYAPSVAGCVAGVVDEIHFDWHGLTLQTPQWSQLADDISAWVARWCLECSAWSVSPDPGVRTPGDVAELAEREDLGVLLTPLQCCFVCAWFNDAAPAAERAGTSRFRAARFKATRGTSVETFLELNARRRARAGQPPR